MVYKKDITPFAKGGTVKKHKGKGSSTPPPNPLGQLTGRYPKPAPPQRVPAPMAPPMGLPPDEAA